MKKLIKGKIVEAMEVNVYQQLKDAVDDLANTLTFKDFWIQMNKIDEIKRKLSHSELIKWSRNK